ANWAAGTGNGGRYSGAAIANTTYHVWLVAKAAGADVDVYMAPSAVAATVLAWLQAEVGGSAYLYLWRIGSILRESGAIASFVQTGDFFQRVNAATDRSTSSITGGTAILVGLSVPDGIKVEASITAYWDQINAVEHLIITSPDQADVAPNVTNGVVTQGLQAGPDPRAAIGLGKYVTNTSRQLRFRTDATGNLGVATAGWLDFGRRFA
ncbi:MAG: hypothetical protein ACK52I_20745, partial [Pseudomonadota bacterium]